jgi:hypothetical protein
VPSRASAVPGQCQYRASASSGPVPVPVPVPCRASAVPAVAQAVCRLGRSRGARLHGTHGAHAATSTPATLIIASADRPTVGATPRSHATYQYTPTVQRANVQRAPCSCRTSSARVMPCARERARCNQPCTVLPADPLSAHKRARQSRPKLATAHGPLERRQYGPQ